MKYFYRTDSASNLRSIEKEGLRCGSAGRISPMIEREIAKQYPGLDLSIPVESAHAKRAGLPVPSAEHMFASRLYFWTNERVLTPGNGVQLYPCDDWLRPAIRRDGRLGLRFPAHVLDKALLYPDGFFDNAIASYAVFPGLPPETPVIPPKLIEVRVKGRWVSLLTYRLISYLVR